MNIDRREFIKAAGGLLIGASSGCGFLNKLVTSGEELDDLYKQRYENLAKEDRNVFLKDINDEFDMGFIFIRNYENIDDVVRSGLMVPRKELYRGSDVVTFAVRPLMNNSESEKDVSTIVIDNAFNLPLFGSKSVCVLFDNIFRENYYYFMSAVRDHETVHAKGYSKGIFVNGREIKGSDAKKFTNAQTVNEIYQILTEATAYRNQLSGGFYSGKISESYKKLLEENYLDFYLKLWKYDPEDETVKYLKKSLFYEPWLTSRLTKENGQILDRKSRRLYEMNF